MTEAKKNKKRPIYIDRLPPCNNTCPSGQNIQAWLALSKLGKYQEAWKVIMQEHPIPATIGRVCYHPCEGGCNRRGFDSAININAVERFLGDMALAEGWMPEIANKKSGKKVLVIGAGPAGLSAAYHLCRFGHEVTIHDAAQVGGGMMHYGIPEYRLPRAILDAEIKRIEKMGVEIKYQHKVNDLIAEREQGNFDAVFVAVGAPVGKGVKIPVTGKGCVVVDSLKFLEDIEYKKTPKIKGQRVLVYGGGNTAIDAARSALRLGAESVEIIYRRNREKMPAYDFEINEAIEEGVTMRMLRTIKQVDDQNVTLEIMQLDPEGWPVSAGKTEVISADLIILALGLNVDTDFLRKVQGIAFNSDNTLVVDQQLMTGASGIFAGGDVIPYDRSVTTALGHGKKAARNIDAFLRGEKYVKVPKHELAGYDKIINSYYAKADRKDRGKADFATRKKGFAEVVQGLSSGDTVHECTRCFSCGNCFECDTCFKVCPVKAIIKLGPGKRYRIDYDLCIRCGLCVKRCPCGAMMMGD
jgi:formate dehydrogenase (NADP+) beta subunit